MKGKPSLGESIMSITFVKRQKEISLFALRFYGRLMPHLAILVFNF